MADSIKDVTPEETGDLDNTKNAPPSPRGLVGKEATMADISDDEVVITGAKQKENVSDHGTFNKDTDIHPLDGGIQVKSPPRRVCVMPPPRLPLPPVSPRGTDLGYQFPPDI